MTWQCGVLSCQGDGGAIKNKSERCKRETHRTTVINLGCFVDAAQVAVYAAKDLADDA